MYGIRFTSESWLRCRSYRFSVAYLIAPLPHTGDSVARRNSLEFDFLRSFMLSPCITVSLLSNRNKYGVIFKYVDFVYTL